ncbi:MAG: DUF1080 domain-containing protein [Porticoccaceae bacterium]|jgi:hypothetical protein|nr:DUF1080 domain-containing protein [Porticoccaceae bacterium]
MKKIYLFCVAVFLAGCGSLPNFLVDLPLIGGELGDFKSAGDAEWVLEDGVISAIRGEANGYIYTKETYTDYDMTLEVFIEDATNSGIYTRCDVEAINPGACYEFNIWDNHTTYESRTGAIVRIAPPTTDVPTIDRWTTMRVRSEGDHHQFWIDGISVNDLRDDQFGSAGVIVLQYGGANGMVRFRNIEITKL